MGKQTKAIISMNLKTVITELNKALADEFLAAYQYWIGSKVVKGYFRKTVQDELLEHSKDEFRHAEMITDRIIQLDGTPIINPKDWYKLTTCGFMPPTNPNSIEILKQNLKGERCAIGIYNNLLKKLKHKDENTFHMVAHILKDEIEHENDLEAILDDIEVTKKTS
ncbi:MAG: Bacterioferritin [Candidatus Anoxychlamydiales bacterium]|nr:Bacterioferritin [Candidatus Anoxychlamydiales bacterium]NGX40804.1 Bacterioferritin [Candidatus Anoxychlamydiales bacterium]HEU64166.1 ferritin [Chlamydiota bacterium]